MVKMECGSVNRQVIIMFFLFIALVISSCSSRKTIEISQPSHHEQQLEEQNRQLTTEVERLQQKLLEKQTVINKLVLSKQHTTREVVRTKAKLRSHSSKAETVANIAEVKTMLKAVAENSVNEQQQHAVGKTEQAIAMSVDALKEGDIDKAFKLSNRAQELIQPISALPEKNFLKNGQDVIFVDPVTMEVLQTCNVRTGPGMKEDVRFTLESGTQIKALAYVRNWIQIEHDILGKGWVYYQLLGIVQLDSRGASPVSASGLS